MGKAKKYRKALEEIHNLTVEGEALFTKCAKDVEGGDVSENAIEGIVQAVVAAGVYMEAVKRECQRVDVGTEKRTSFMLTRWDSTQGVTDIFSESTGRTEHQPDGLPEVITLTGKRIEIGKPIPETGGILRVDITEVRKP